MTNKQREDKLNELIERTGGARSNGTDFVLTKAGIEHAASHKMMVFSLDALLLPGLTFQAFINMVHEAVGPSQQRYRIRCVAAPATNWKIGITGFEMSLRGPGLVDRWNLVTRLMDEHKAAIWYEAADWCGEWVLCVKL